MVFRSHWVVVCWNILDLTIRHQSEQEPPGTGNLSTRKEERSLTQRGRGRGTRQAGLVDMAVEDGGNLADLGAFTVCSDCDIGPRHPGNQPRSIDHSLFRVAKPGERYGFS